MALLPPAFLKSVVSIEAVFDGELKTIGTGFIYAKVLGMEGDKYRVKRYLVTAKHVLYKKEAPMSTQRKGVMLRFDSLGESPQLFRLPLYDKGGNAIFSSTLGECDVAVVPINGKVLDDAGIDFVDILDETALDSLKYEEVGLSNGDGVFYLGFPLGLRGVEKNYAMCRSGSIARVDNETVRENVVYLDAPVFPGNSGGPVFIKPQLVSIEGTPPIEKAWLLGMVVSFLSMNGERESLSDDQVERLESHLGLSKIIIVDAIKEAIEESERRSAEMKETKSIK